MTNLLRNGDFSDDWSGSHDVWVFPVGGDPYKMEQGNCFTPPGWLAWFAHKPGTWDQPEVTDAWAHVDERRVRSGPKALKLFTSFCKHDAGLMQRVEVEEGATLQLYAYGHAWSNHNGDGFPHPNDGRWSEGAGYDVVAWTEDEIPELSNDPQNDAKGNVAFCVGIDPLGGLNPFAESVRWGSPLWCYNGYTEPVWTEAVAKSSTVTVFLRTVTLWPFKHNDAYWDDCSLVATEEPPPPPKCENPARVPYDRAYVLLPPGVTKEEAHELLDKHWERRRTIGFSADDAGVGCGLGERRVIAYKPGNWPSNLEAFFEQYYEGVVYEVEGEEPPPPPPLLEPTSLHWQRRAQGDAEFVAAVKPQVAKTVLNMEFARWIKEESPDTLTVFRHWRADQGEFLKMNDGPRKWLECFIDSLQRERENVDFCESLNEVVATSDLDGIQRCVDFDCQFCEELKREGFPARPLILNVAVGNPQHGAETELMIPAARAVVDAGGALGYHAYWGSRPDGYCTMSDVFEHYSGRALMSWDATFTAAGVYPRYVFGEGGAVLISDTATVKNYQLFSRFAVTEARRRAVLEAKAESIKPAEWVKPLRMIHKVQGGYALAWLNPNAGWKDACSSWSHYVEQILEFRRRVREWNAANGNRCLGLTLFTLDSDGGQWGSFHLGGRLDRLAEALTA